MTAGPTFTLDPDDERRLAATLFNRTWDLLERDDRSAGEDDEMLHTAHASRYHWGRVGQPVNLARGEWQVSRVYAVLGRAEPARHHARRCLELAEAHDLGPFDAGCGHEALARAYGSRGITPPNVLQRLVVFVRYDVVGDDGHQSVEVFGGGARVPLLMELARLRPRLRRGRTQRPPSR